MNQNILSATRERVVGKKEEPLSVEEVKERVIGLLKFWCELDKDNLTRIQKSLTRKSERAKKIAGKIRRIANKRIKHRLLRGILRISEKWARSGITKAKGKAKNLFRKENRFRQGIRELKNDNSRLAIEILEEYIENTPTNDTSGDPGGYLCSPSAINLIREYQQFIEVLRQLEPKKNKAN